MIKKVLITILVSLSVVGLYYFKSVKKVEESKIHYHAGFIIFDNSNKIDFSDNKYMLIKPCTIDNAETENEDEQIEKAHLHDNIGDLIHSEAKDAKWGDLFTNIKYEINYSNATAYINGELIKDFEEKSINAYDSLVLFTGKVDEKLLSQGVSKVYIEEQEEKGTTCSD